jgi:hypothetical protein
MMAGEEFVQVQMSAAGVAYAGVGGVIRAENSRSHFAFVAGEAQRVVRGYEWGYLRDLKDAAGKPLFEIVPSAAAGTLSTAAEPHTEATSTIPVSTEEHS